MVARRWQLIAGGVVLALMLNAATFSLGMYVGEHGWTREGLRYKPGPQGVPGANLLPDVGPGAGLQLQGGQPGLLAPQPDLIGRLLLIAADSLELATPAGPRLVRVDGETAVQDERGQPLALGDLHVGDVLAVFGEAIPGGERQFHATRLVRLPPLQPQGPASPQPHS